ncbi:7TM chemoreceptor [Oesophagostomum dentatum]|uniref:7TM chemoreceptor n=1 Tax=Oesophagostomum dentatum TaxID=61180 RepID=A0A0B1TK38_OESDE|nr:7TM chemoreceptor [Oesophagostomum dentatum]
MDFAFAFAGIGPEREQPTGQVFIMLFVVAFITSLLLVTNSFIYRYVHVCSSPESALLRIYHSTYGIGIVLVINIAIIVNWLAMIYIVFWPDPIVIQRLSGVVLELAGIELSQTGHLCISLKLSELTPIKIGLIGELLLLMCIMGNIMLYSATKISSTMKRETTSDSLRKMHRQMFMLLLLQIKMMNDFLSTATYAILTMAIVNNLALFYVYFSCSLKNRMISQDNYFIMVSTGYLSQNPYGDIPLFIYCVSFFTTLLLVTNGFMHRYLQLCRKQLFEIYSSKKSLVIIILINLALLTSYTVLLFVVFYPDDYFTELVQKTAEIKGCDMTGRSFIGFSVKYSVSSVSVFLILYNVVIMGLLECIHFVCAKKIDNCLRRSALSEKSQKLQRRMFILLLVQAACPAIFLHVPCTAALVFLFTGINTTTLITNILGVLLVLYPFSNPLIVIAFVKDYRNFILLKLRLIRTIRKPLTSITQNNVFVSDTRAAVAQSYIHRTVTTSPDK